MKLLHEETDITQNRTSGDDTAGFGKKDVTDG